jgi:serine/threonine protein phosphatase PrpC
MPIQTTGFVYPPKSSDYRLCAQSEDGAVVVAAVLDTIGRPKVRGLPAVVDGLGEGFRRLVERDEAREFDSLKSAVHEVIAGTNDLVIGLRQGAGAAGILGYCLALAAGVGERFFTIRLGDCRAYRVDPPRPNRLAAVRCLHADQNMLNELVETHLPRFPEGVQLFRSELLEYSRRLTGYVGIPAEGLRAILEGQTAELDLTDGRGVLLLTDGCFLPVIRSRLKDMNYRIDRDALYLESWMAEFLGRQGPFTGGAENWDAALDALKEGCLQSSRSRGRYRDDMAAAAVFAVG